MENKILDTFYHVQSLLYQNFDEIPEDLVESGERCCALFPDFYKEFCNATGDAVTSDRELASYYLMVMSVLQAHMDYFKNKED